MPPYLPTTHRSRRFCPFSCRFNVLNILTFTPAFSLLPPHATRSGRPRYTCCYVYFSAPPCNTFTRLFRSVALPFRRFVPRTCSCSYRVLVVACLVLFPSPIPSATVGHCVCAGLPHICYICPLPCLPACPREDTFTHDFVEDTHLPPYSPYPWCYLVTGLFYQCLTTITLPLFPSLPPPIVDPPMPIVRDSITIAGIPLPLLSQASPTPCCIYSFPVWLSLYHLPSILWGYPLPMCPSRYACPTLL